MNPKTAFLLGCVPLLSLAVLAWAWAAGSSPETSAAASDSRIAVVEGGGKVRVTWPISPQENASAVFSLAETEPLIESLGLAVNGQQEQVIARGLNPVTLLTVGERDLKTPAGWVAFFDNPPKRPYQTFPVKLGRRSLKITATGSRTTVSLAEASAGSFYGDVRFTFYRDSPLIHAETVMQTKEDGRAIIYDMGLGSPAPDWQALAWKDPSGTAQRTALDPQAAAAPLAVAGRALAAEGRGGSLAVFPAPHQFFYPQDEAFNLKFLWHGRGYGGQVPEWGMGIRQSATGDQRYVPWFNAPPETEQHLGIFYLLSPRTAPEALETVARYTHGDRFKKLPGYRTFTSHFHVEHTQEFMRRQKEQNTGKVPQGLEVPGFVRTFKARGVEIAHMAEFHYQDGSKIPEEERLLKLKTLHEECVRLSDEELLVLPGEEPNIQLGGHWISLFPKPVYWTLNHAAEKPFREDVADYGTVYRVGSPEEVLKLMEQEGGLMWTAHARIKGSLGFPDKYRTRDFYKSPHFLGAAWKAMPADLSWSKLGKRVLELQDDMANWGDRKYTPGEVDTFRMEPHFETYAHMNINYLKLDKLPRFNEGWQPVVDALRTGSFFTSTGEVLIPSFAVGGKSSGQTLELSGGAPAVLEADLEWTFPLAFAEIISGDGKNVFRQRIDFTDTGEHGTRKLRVPLELKGRTWVRFEVWDIAANGAYTQPVWLGDSKIAAPNQAGPPPETWARFVPERKDDFAWENDLTAFRLYGPAIRPAGQAFKPGMEDSGIDCWTKRVPYPVIDRWYAGERHAVGYHQDHGEGCDLYSVGSSRGCGGTAIWKNGRMILSGPFQSWKLISREKKKTVFELTYLYDTEGGNIQETKRITIQTGERLFRSESTFTKDGQPVALEIAIGITTHEGKAKATLDPARGWMSCWETIEGSGLGTGVAMDPSAMVSMQEFTTPRTREHHALLTTLTDISGKTVHYAGYGWERAGMITSAEQWQEYLARAVTELE